MTELYVRKILNSIYQDAASYLATPPGRNVKITRIPKYVGNSLEGILQIDRSKEMTDVLDAVEKSLETKGLNVSRDSTAQKVTIYGWNNGEMYEAVIRFMSGSISQLKYRVNIKREKLIE